MIPGDDARDYFYHSCLVLHKRWCKLDQPKQRSARTQDHSACYWYAENSRHQKYDIPAGKLPSLSAVHRSILFRRATETHLLENIPIGYCRDSKSVKTRKSRYFTGRVSVHGKWNWKNKGSKAPKLCRLTDHLLGHKCFISPRLWNAAFQCLSGLLAAAVLDQHHFLDSVRHYLLYLLFWLVRDFLWPLVCCILRFPPVFLHLCSTKVRKNLTDQSNCSWSLFRQKFSR